MISETRCSHEEGTCSNPGSTKRQNCHLSGLFARGHNGHYKINSPHIKLGKTSRESIWFCTFVFFSFVYNRPRRISSSSSAKDYTNAIIVLNLQITKEITKQSKRFSKYSNKKRREREKDELNEQSMVSSSKHRSSGSVERPIRDVPLELYDPIGESRFKEQCEICFSSGEQVLFVVHR